MNRNAVTALWLVRMLVVLAAGSLSAQTLQFNTVYPEVIGERLNRLSKDNGERGQTLHALFEESGCEGDRLAQQAVKGSRIPNVICTLPGTEDSWIVVGAHFDKAVGPTEGAIDNWSGASVLPSLFESLAAHPRRFTFVFIGFSDEERGMVGSRHYVSQLPKEQLAKIRAMVNIDSVGLSSTKVWVSRADKNLVSLLAQLANAMKLPVDGINMDEVGNSDSNDFLLAKIPVIDFHSIDHGMLSILHSPQDTLTAVRLDDYYTTYRLLTAYLAFLDMRLNPSGTPPDSH
jgi:hypothetical protein